MSPGSTGRRRRYLEKQALKRFLKHKRLNALASPGPYPYVIVLDHLKPAFNIGKIFRSAEAFGAREVHLIGTEFFDPSPAKGSFKVVPARFYETFDESYGSLRGEGYTFFVLDPTAPKTLWKADLPDRSAFVFGHEEFGLRFRPADYQGICTLRIPQQGRVQSLNVSVAASIVMAEYVRRREGGEGVCF
ncbi:MAG: TrmH family RNA methyltransferase [Deltaproteobacteria bacterium]|nr:TrmH family RNA methyltransferase [Deltaproteobacteria bacterium]MBW1948950.1 TrmH family RNA methyltransferase [Deltaproteobacteria bacterium]